MGCFDSVMVPCPKCGEKREFQTKSGECLLKVYDLGAAPPDVMQDVNRHAPHHCEKCNVYFEVSGPLEGGYSVIEVPGPERDWKAEYQEALESRRMANERETEATKKAMDWEAAYWALVKAIRK